MTTHQQKFTQPEAFLSQVSWRLPPNLATTECSLCYEETSFVGVGDCGHDHVCWLCSLRLRWICDDTDCAICKHPLGQLSIRRVGHNNNKSNVPNPQHIEFKGIQFESEPIFLEAKRLVSYTCPYPCGEDPEFHFRSLSDLQTHLKRDHAGGIYCSICLDHRQCFLPEQPLFGPMDLALHHKQEHPGCDFCSREKKFYSTDELMAHMNQAHFKCVVCDRLDHRNEYYANFDCLDKHFEESHYRCEYPECREQRFVVFGEEEDLRLHWLEKHGRGRAIAIGGSQVGSASNKLKKTRNRNSQTPVNLVVHFRGARVPSHNTQENDTVDRYPDLGEGRKYDKRLHSRVIVGRPKWMSELSNAISRVKVDLKPSSDEYKSENVAFFKKVIEVMSQPEVCELKNVSVKFTQGSVGVFEYLMGVKGLLGKLDDKTAVPLIGDLVRLMPDLEKRQTVIAFLTRDVGKKVESKTTSKTEKIKHTDVEIPARLFEPGSKKPCLIQALHSVLESQQSIKGEIPHSILAAMENKVNGLDRVQLSTLSEMRQHLLTLAEGRIKNVSWTYADGIIGLRPLLYRLMQIPETHRAKERELMISGWSQFVDATNNALEKFNQTESNWMKVYVAYSVVRLGTMGVTETRRHDFPSLPISAYFPSVGSETASSNTVVVPTRQDFPVGLPMAPPVVSIQPTAASNTQWRNNRQALREEAFPELAPVVVETNKLDFSKPWNCPRCTFRNTRDLSRNCEICGLERPPPGEKTESQPASTPPEPANATARPKRTKQRIVLSSSTQRDYTR